MKPNADDRRFFSLISVGAFALALGGLSACGDDGSAKPGAGSPDGGGDVAAASGTGGAPGAAPGGEIPAPPDGAMPPGITVDAAYNNIDAGCCQLELSVADPTGDETTARLVGDQAPLDVAGGLPLTYSNGRWRASVCVPQETLLTYRFYFGSKMVAPAAPDDAGAPAGETTPDAGAPDPVDADVVVDAEDFGDAEPGPAPPDAQLITIEDYRIASDVSTQVGVDGSGRNLLGPLLTCSLPPPDQGPTPEK